MLTRRVVPAMTVTLTAWAGLACATGSYLRRQYQAPLVTGNPNVTTPARVFSQWRTRGGKPASIPAINQALQGTGVTKVAPGVPANWPVPGKLEPCAVPHPARLYATDDLPARQPVLAVPVDRGQLGARAVPTPHSRDRLAGPPARGPKRRQPLPEPASNHRANNPGNQAHTRHHPGSGVPLSANRACHEPSRSQIAPFGRDHNRQAVTRSPSITAAVCASLETSADHAM